MVSSLSYRWAWNRVGLQGEVHVRFLGTRSQDSGLRLGVSGGTGFRCFSDDPEMVRKPDASFVLKTRFPDGIPEQGFLTTVPDLVVEVISPHDNAYEVNLKVEDWRTAGVSLLWIIWPVTQTIDVYQHDSVHQLTIDDELTADPFHSGVPLRGQRHFSPIAEPTSLDPPSLDPRPSDA